jgi:hypothetical protein
LGDILRHGQELQVLEPLQLRSKAHREPVAVMVRYV